MNKAYLYILLFSASTAAFAERPLPEVIEILAPKQQLSVMQNNQATWYFDDRLTNNLNRTVADKLATLSGVSLHGQGGQFQSYSIRGFSRGRVRTEIDGIPIITDRRAGNSVSFLASELFSDINLLKGPSSVLYGSQALGGVVNLSTAINESAIYLHGQSNGDEFGITAKHQQNNLAMALAYQSSNNQQSPNDTELNTQFERVSGLIKYQTKNQGLTTTFSWLPSVGKDIGKSNVKYLNSEVSSYPEEQHSLAQIQINSDQGWLVKLFHHYQNWDSETDRFEQYQALTQYQSHTIGGQWLIPLNVTFADSYLGVDWLSRTGVNIDSLYDIQQTSDNLTPYLLNSSLRGDQDNLAIFNKNRWQIGKVKLALGLRYDWLTQRSDGQQDISAQEFNGTFSVSMPVVESLNWSFELANGFRYPTLSERFFNGSTPRGLVAGNDALKPEASVGLQSTLSWQVSENLTMRSSFYHYDLDNYIERYRVNPEQLSYRNLSSAQINGLELDIIWFMNDNIEHQFSYQQQTGKNEQQQTLDDLQPNKLNWNMLINVEDITLSHSISHYFSISNVGPSELTRSEVTLWNSSLSYQLTQEQSVSIKLNNITNESYYASLDEDAPLQPKRSICLSTKWQF